MKHLLYIVMCISMFLPFRVKGQRTGEFELIRSIQGNFSDFYVDNLDNIYLITLTNQLKKIDNNGDSAAIFNDIKHYGYLSSIDVTNPLKILLYYKDYSTVLVLDHLLNIRNKINLRNQNIFSVKAIAPSYDNNIWLFDEQDYKLKKINEEGKQLMETVDFRTFLQETPSPLKIIDRENYVYLYDTAKGFYIFDYYGSFKTKLPFIGWKNIEVNNKMMYGFNNNTMFTYTLNSLMIKEYPLPSDFVVCIAMKAMNGKVYLLKNNGIDIYRVK